MSGSRRSPQAGGPAAAGLEFAAALLPVWGFPPGTGIAPAGEQGTNNRTFLVRCGQQRYVLRVSGFLSAAEVRAEHQILQRLRQGGLPFQVPEPVAAPGGRTVIETPAGPAAVCRWLPGVHPGMDGEAAFERFGRAAGLLGAALAGVPLADAVRDWRTDPRWVRPDDPPVDAVCGQLRSAGMSAAQAELLAAAARRTGRWWPGAGGLPAQVIHGDLTPGNVLAGPDTAEVTGVLDFELAGAGFRAQDILAALYNSTALRTPRWPARTAAFLRGCAAVRRLEPAEVAALPELLIARSLGSLLWRAARWRAGLGHFGEVTAHADRLEVTMRWLAANEGAFLSIAAAANAGS
jgi:homoserine kinase type II